MKNVAVIFAGGTGQRMGVKDVPKQFLEVEGKPIHFLSSVLFVKA